MQDYNQAPYSPFNSGIPLRTGVTQANADIEVFLPRRPQTSQPLPGKPQRTQPPQRKCNVKATVPRTRRRRAKQHNDSPQTRTRIANLGEFGPRIMDHYAGDTDENRLSVLGEFETYMDQNDGRLPFDCIGARGPRNGGGKFFCRICSKNWPNLQKMMADLLGHWQLKPWHCELCEKSYQGLNEYTRHQGEVHGIIVQNLRCDRASSTDSLSSFAEDIGHSPGANESSRILGTPPQIGNSAPIPVQSSVRRPMARRTSDLNRNAHHHHHHPYSRSPRSSPIVSAVLSSTGHLQVPTLDIGHGAHHRMVNTNTLQDTYSQYAMEGINPGLGHFYAPNGYNRFYESMPAGSGAYPHDAQSYGIDLLSPTAGSTMGPAIASESTIGPVYGASVYGDFLYSDQDSNTSAEQDAEVWLGYSCGRGPGPNSQSVCWCMTLILLQLGTSECFTMGPRRKHPPFADTFTDVSVQQQLLRRVMIMQTRTSRGASSSRLLSAVNHRNLLLFFSANVKPVSRVSSLIYRSPCFLRYSQATYAVNYAPHILLPAFGCSIQLSEEGQPLLLILFIESERTYVNLKTSIDATLSEASFAIKLEKQ